VNRRRLAASIAASTLAAILLARGMFAGSAERRDDSAVSEARGGSTTTERSSNVPSPRAAAKGEKQDAPRPPSAQSLRGTDVDGALRVGPDGSLLIGPEILQLFDYFFTAEGEESEETIRARILAAIRERVDGPAALQATALLDRYLAYRKDTASIDLPKEQETDPKARLDAIRDLRRKHFGEESEKLFGDEEREGEVAIDESRVRQDESLSDEARADKLAELDETLPPQARAAREASTMPIRARAEEEAMRAEGASKEDVRAYREATFGAEAADRLTALDEARAAWKRRVDAFKEQREKISTKDEAAFREAEQALLDRSFTTTEQRRVRATLAMEAK
jgi:lipase chaperone LimK